MNLLEVTRVELMTSEMTGQEFFRATFRPVKDYLGNGKALYASDKSGSRLYNPGKQPQAGDVFEGQILTFETTPYQIGDNTVSKITAVVLSDENGIEVANRSLERNNACVIHNGKQTKELVTSPVE